MHQHLPKQRVTAEGVSSSATGEVLTIGLLDSITIHWLLAIDKRLIGIIKTEFAAQLKTHRLCQLVKQIATNIDELLLRYNQMDKDTIAKVSAPHDSVDIVHATSDIPVNMIIRRLERLEAGHNSRFGFKDRGSRKARIRQSCNHCSFINKQLGSNLDIKHSPETCKKKKFSVNMDS